VTLGEEFRARAWQAAGVAPGTHARLVREHERLHKARRARDAIDLAERARLMRGIAAFYGRLHLAHPDRLLWAGFAAVAVNDGVRPVTELSVAASEMLRTNPALAPIRAGVEDGLKAAFETNFAIFSDLGWVHLAFLEGGVAELRRLHAQGELHPSLLHGFEEIEAGRVMGGNLALFRHEQDASVTPVFERYGEALEMLTRLGLVTVPNRRLAGRAAELGRCTWWKLRGQSYGPFEARWRWLVHHAWEPMLALHRERGLLAEVTRAVAGRQERFAVAARFAAVAAYYFLLVAFTE
jgi:hypothetical protein